MANEKSYHKNEATNLVAMNLDNGIAWSEGISKGDTDMPKRLTDRVKVNGQDRWVHGYSTHDFRDTCATEWRENGMALDVVARLLGHSKTETTEKRYVKYRDEVLNDARRLMV